MANASPLLRIFLAGPQWQEDGSVGATSLVAQQAEIVDLDGPLRLAVDCGPGLRNDGDTIHPPDPKLSGGPG